MSVRPTLRLVGVALALCSGDLYAQRAPTAKPPSATSYVRRIIDGDQGLPDTQVGALAQTFDGYLWLGTRRGLARYDGLSFQLFSPDNTPALLSPKVNGLDVFAGDDRLWIETSRGLTVLEQGKFRRVPAEQVPFENTWEVIRDHRGRVWVAGSFGVRVGDGTTFTAVPGVHAYIYSLVEDAAGRVWMAGREYLASIGDGDVAPVVVPLGTGERFFDLVTDGQRGLWVATRTGAWHLNVDNPRAVRVLERVAIGDPVLGNEVWSLLRAPDGDIWLGTERLGVLRWDGQHLFPDESTGGAIPDQVWALMADARGRVWAGTSAGLLRHQKSAFTTFVDGLLPRSVWSVRGDVNGTLWAATSDGRVYWRKGERWTAVTARVGRNLSSVTWPHAEGGMFIVSALGRVLLASPSGVRDISRALGFEGLAVNSLFEDTDGSHWAATDSGVYHASGGKARRMNAQYGLSSTVFPEIMLRDVKGRLLFGRPYLTMVQNGAVTHLDPSRGLTNDDVTSLLSDTANIWIGTADSGLFVFRHNRVVQLGRFDPRLKVEVLGIVEDDEGFLWLTSSFGLLRVARRDLERLADGESVSPRVRSFDRADGLPTTEFNGDYQSLLFKDARGHLWLPNYAGVVRVDPSAVHTDSTPPQVHIERLAIDGQDRPTTAGIGLDQRPRRVDITFAATNAAVPTQVRAEYRLIGVDTAWQHAGLRRTVSFGPLQGGSYRFEVRVAEEDGEWNPVWATLDLRVPLALNERAWFLPVLFLIVAGITALGVRLRLGVMRRRERAARADERTRELEASQVALEQRVHERTAALARELDERMRLEQRLATAKKLESIGRLAGGVAHEINNSITGVLGFTELARHAAGDNSSILGDLNEVRKAGQRVADITRQLLAFARRQHTEPVAVHLHLILAELSRSLQQAVGDRIQLQVHENADVAPAMADPSQVEQLVFNLVMNARDAMPEGGTVVLRLGQSTLPAPRSVGDFWLPAGDYVTLEVIDTGIGMSEEVQTRLFEPFFTTKEVNQGTGLGLAVCHGIASRHGGAIEVESAPDRGTHFTVWLPLWTGDLKADTTTPTNPVGTECILLVEDETDVREVTGRIFSRLGYRVLEARDGAAALDLVADGVLRIDIVVTDVMMPKITGLELVRRLRQLRPSLPVVFISGYAGLDGAALAEMSAFGPMVAKPFTPDTLTRAVRRELDARNAMDESSALVPGRYQS